MNQVQLQTPAPAAQVAARVLRSSELGESISDVARAPSLVPAWCFVGISALSVCVVVTTGALSDRSCRVKPVPLMLGAATDISIAAPADMPCTILVRTGSTSLDAMTIEAPPQNGTLAERGRTGVIYRPSRGFKGDDAFTFSLRGGVPESAIIRVRASIK